MDLSGLETRFDGPVSFYFLLAGNNCRCKAALMTGSFEFHAYLYDGADRLDQRAWQEYVKARPREKVQGRGTLEEGCAKDDYSQITLHVNTQKLSKIFWYLFTNHSSCATACTVLPRWTALLCFSLLTFDLS